MHWMGRALLVAFGMIGSATNAATGQELQPDPAGYPPRSFYIEAGGLPAFEGGPFSVNLEQRLIPATYLRVGAFYGQVDGEMSLKLPILLDIVVPGKAHNLEVGAGVRWDALGSGSDDVRLAATVGYRYQEMPGGALLRAGLNFDLRSLSGGSDAWKLGPWPSLAIGFGF